MNFKLSSSPHLIRIRWYKLFLLNFKKFVIRQIVITKKHTLKDRKRNSLIQPPKDKHYSKLICHFLTFLYACAYLWCILRKSHCKLASWEVLTKEIYLTLFSQHFPNLIDIESPPPFNWHLIVSHTSENTVLILGQRDESIC